LKPITRTILIILTVLLVSLGTFLVYYQVSFRRAEANGTIPPLAFYTVITASMEPTIKVDDVILIRRVNNPETIKLGDIVTFISMNERSRGIPVTHRVQNIENTPEGLRFITAGDSNITDDMESVSFESILGRMIFKIPGGAKTPFFSNS